MLANTMSFAEPDSMRRYFGSCFKSLRAIQVWPPSKHILNEELTVTANTILVYISVKSSIKSDEVPELRCIQHLLLQSLNRALQFMSESPSLLLSICREQSITKLMQRIFEAIKDPIIHFRSLPVVGNIVTVCGLACLLVRLQQEEAEVHQIFLVFQEITSFLSEDILQETLPYKNGQFHERLPDDDNDENIPCLQDFVSIILCLCPSNIRKVQIVFKPWQWLDIICLCKGYMSKKSYTEAMKHFEALLNTPLDPEIRSCVLCLFANCYLHQGCFQLALQACKTALKAAKDNELVYVYLTEIYAILKQEDLELETLNLLVRLLSDKNLRSKTLTPDPHLDAVVFSLSGVQPSVSLPETLCHFARRCIDLHRNTEASEKYMTLLKLLEEDPQWTSAGSGQTAFRPFDVQEIIVESAEALALAKQTKHCLYLVEKFMPVLEANDSFFQAASNILYTNIHDDSLPSSQDSFLGSQLNIAHQSFSVPTAKKEENLKTADGIPSNSNFQFDNLCSSVKKKRQRLCSVSMDVDHTNDEVGLNHELEAGIKKFEDPWLPTSLVVRLLLSKVDVLIPSQGYCDDVMSCLFSAQDLLLNHSTPIFHLNKDSGALSDEIDSPSLKHRKIKLDGSQASSSQSNTVPIRNGQTVPIANNYEVSDLWRKMLFKVGERMQKAFLSRKQDVSAFNVSKLLQQLIPDKT